MHCQILPATPGVHGKPPEERRGLGFRTRRRCTDKNGCHPHGRRPSAPPEPRQGAPPRAPGGTGKGPSPGPQKRTSLGGRLLPSKPGSRTTRRKHDALRFSPDRPTSSKSRCSRPGQRGTPRTPRRPGAENAGPLSVDHGHSSGELSRPCVAGAQNWPRVRALHESKGLER